MANSQNSMIEQECQDLEGLLTDIYRRMANDDRSSAGHIAALLRLSAAEFERLGHNGQGLVNGS